VLVVQANSFNRSRIQTVIVARDSVVNISQLITLDRSFLTDVIGKIPDRVMSEVVAGLRLVLEL
jgi:mRNA interferase MazF